MTTTTDTTITPFSYDGAQVRVVTDEDGETWFIAADVAHILGYRMASDMVRRLDDDERGTHSMRTPGGKQEMATITEAGLYSAVLGAKIPQAKAFKRWVTHEVLPSIRKRGGYLTPEATERALSDPDFIIRLATSLKEERAARAALEARVAEDAPLTRFARTLVASDADLLVRQVAAAITAQGVRVSQPVLFTWLRENGWLCRNRGRLWNSPTQWALDRGFMRSSVILIATNHGDEEKVTPKITTAGQADLVDGFLTGRYSLEGTVA